MIEKKCRIQAFIHNWKDRCRVVRFLSAVFIPLEHLSHQLPMTFAPHSHTCFTHLFSRPTFSVFHYSCRIFLFLASISWLLLGVLFLMYGARVYLLQGFYIVTYGLGIFLLNLLIGFLSPLEEDLDGPVLPLNDVDEFKPFVRRLPEFKFWYACAKAVVFSLFLTLFSVFDVPVFWPILLIYFCVLFVLTMKRQIKHMMKHKYLPFSFGKKKYTVGAGGASKKVAEDIRTK